MEFVWTAIIAFVLFLIAIILISTGLILMGKSRIRGGSCGRLPSKNKDDSCGTDQSCSLCSSGKEKKDDSSLQQK